MSPFALTDRPADPGTLGRPVAGIAKPAAYFTGALNRDAELVHQSLMVKILMVKKKKVLMNHTGYLQGMYRYTDVYCSSGYAHVWRR